MRILGFIGILVFTLIGTAVMADMEVYRCFSVGMKRHSKAQPNKRDIIAVPAFTILMSSNPDMYYVLTPQGQKIALNFDEASKDPSRVIKQFYNRQMGLVLSLGGNADMQSFVVMTIQNKNPKPLVNPGMVVCQKLTP